MSKVHKAALASKVHKSTALPNGGESQTMPSWFLASEFSRLAHPSAIDRPLSRGAGPY